MTNVAEQAQELGLAVLENTLWLTSFYAKNVDYFHYISVLQAAQAAELLIKAKIAEIDSDAIYETNKKTKLPCKDKTIKYSSLCSKIVELFYLDEHKFPNKTLFDEFGKLRNEIQHLKIPDGVDLKLETMKFIFQVIDPLISDFWGFNVLDYISDIVDEQDEFIFEDLIKMNIPCRIPDELKESYKKVSDKITIVKNTTNFIVNKYGTDYEFLTKNANLVKSGFNEKFESDPGYTDEVLTEAIELIKNKIEYQKWGDSF